MCQYNSMKAGLIKNLQTIWWMPIRDGDQRRGQGGGQMAKRKDTGSGDGEATKTDERSMEASSRHLALKDKPITSKLSRTDALELVQQSAQNARKAGVALRIFKVSADGLIGIEIKAKQCSACLMWRVPEEMTEDATTCQYCTLNDAGTQMQDVPVQTQGEAGNA